MRRRNFLKGAALLSVGAVAGWCTRPQCSHANGCYDNELTGFQAGGFTVPAGETWRLTGLVESDANVIVEGTLVMRAGDTLRFVGVNESAFVGGGMDPVAPDVGLWVMNAGRLDLIGTSKAGWNRTGTDPTWLPSDELVVAPTAVGAYDFAPFTLGSPVPQAKPYLPAAEVANLTRDVWLEGTAGGRSHVFIRNTVPVVHTIDFVGFRHMGPRKNNAKILGRWAGPHFHHSMHNNHGTTLRGCVVRDGGSHAYVPHASHGISFLDCIAYRTDESQFWWDSDVAGDVSDEITYDHCLAADGSTAGAGAVPDAGFALAGGVDNVIRDSAAVGWFGAATAASGLAWPENLGPGAPSNWTIDGFVSHNNKAKGARFWSNLVGPRRTTESFIAYRNAGEGIMSGAYRFSNDWLGALTAENGDAIGRQAGFVHSAVSTDEGVGNLVDGLVMRDERVGIRFNSVQATQLTPTEVFLGPQFIDVQIPVEVKLGINRSRRYDLIRPSVDGADLTPADVLMVSPGQAGSLMRVQRLDNLSAWQMDLNTGQVTEIPPFA